MVAALVGEVSLSEIFKISRFPGLFLENLEIPGVQDLKIPRAPVGEF